MSTLLIEGEIVSMAEEIKFIEKRSDAFIEDCHN